MTYTPNRFNKGSGTYKCQCCGKLTRETGDGESDYELCAKCHFEGLMENSISDGNQKCTCGNTDDFTINYRDHDLTCNKCGARGAYESWAQPAEKVKLTEEERKAKKQERRRARRAAKKAASPKPVEEMTHEEQDQCIAKPLERMGLPQDADSDAVDERAEELVGEKCVTCDNCEGHMCSKYQVPCRLALQECLLE